MNSLLRNILWNITLCFLFILIYGKPVYTLDIQHYAEVKEEFELFNVNEGMSQSTVNAIVQDGDGILWLATEYGINKFNGYDFTVYSHIVFNSSSLIDNTIRAMTVTGDGIICVGTTGGLSIFNPVEQKFKNYVSQSQNPNRLLNNRITSLVVDGDGNLWIGSGYSGLIKYVFSDDSFQVYPFTDDIGEIHVGESVNSMSIGTDGCIWIASNQNHLIKFNTSDYTYQYFNCDRFRTKSDYEDLIHIVYADRSGDIWAGIGKHLLTVFKPADNSFNSFDLSMEFDDIEGSVTAIYEDNSRKLWFGTDAGELFCLDSARKVLSGYCNTNVSIGSLNGNGIKSLYSDDSGSLWIGTWEGLYKLNLADKKFRLYTQIPGEKSGLSFPDIWCIYEDKEGITWVGTNGGGLNRCDLVNNDFQVYKNDPDDPASISENTIYKIFEDSRGDFYLATFSGLNKFDRRTGKTKIFRTDPHDPYSISDNKIISFYEDRSGNFWIGTYNGGLNRFDRDSGKFYNFKHDPADPNSLSNNRVYVFEETQDDILWIGTDGGGLNRLDPATGEFTHFKLNTSNPKGINDNFILDLFYDGESYLWIGTYNSGLNKLDLETLEFEHFTMANGLPNNAIYGIEQDKDGHLWMSTNNGLSKFDIANGEFVNYDESDGLQSREFNSGAHFKAADGKMYFGGIEGFNVFYPENIGKDLYEPPVVITGFKIYDESINFRKSLRTSGAIELKYNDNFFSIAFAALDYRAPDKIHYAYMLEGLSDEWIHIGNRRLVEFTNLDPGDYLFKVMATNSDGVWKDVPLEMRISIIPPIWDRTWFKILLSIIIVIILYFAYYLRVNSIEKKKSQLEREVANRTLELQLRTQELQVINRKQSDLIDERDKLIEDLQKALVEIKTLSGMIPICANCKKVRDDSGFWQQVETYLADRSDVEFSHSLCPGCLKELYPVYYSEKYGDKNQKKKNKN